MQAVASLLDVNSSSYRVLNSSMKIVVGNGKRSEFWDLEVGNNIQLKSVYPRIFALASRKHGMVSDFGNWQDTSWQ